MCGIPARFLRGWSASLRSQIFPKSAQFPRRFTNFLATLPWAPIFPVPVLCLIAVAEFTPRELFDDALTVAPAGRGE
jgi:hypothetical protein